MQVNGLHVPYNKIRNEQSLQSEFKRELQSKLMETENHKLEIFRARDCPNTVLQIRGNIGT